MKYLHSPATENHGRVSVCVEVIDGGNGPVLFAAGIAYCNPTDNFVYKQGKAKAQGFLRQGLHDGILNPRPNSRTFFSALVPYYDNEKGTTPELRFSEMLVDHIDSFIAAAVRAQRAKDWDDSDGRAGRELG